MKNINIIFFSLAVLGFNSLSAQDDHLNSIKVSAFDENANVVGESKSYFRYDGTAWQSQTRAMQRNEILVTQPVYDQFNRPVVSTLPAPLSGTSFSFEKDFLKNSGGTVYDHSDIGQPLTGKLADFYDGSSGYDQDVPATSYPFTRTVFYEDGTEEVKYSFGPGDALQSRPVTSKTLPVAGNELPHYGAMRNMLIGVSPATDDPLNRVTKQLVIDENGKEVITYVNENGEVIASAISGGSNPVGISLSLTNTLTEFHVAAGPNVSVTADNGAVIYNKLTDASVATVSGGSVTIGPGIYYISPNSPLSYNLYYISHAYNFYDNTSRLIASMAPKGVKELRDYYSANSSVPIIGNWTYITFYKYDFYGRLVEMDEPDAGITKYAYRRDGQIRFSENAEQRLRGVFSYTNYDGQGRPVESGEYCAGIVVYGTAGMTAILENTHDEEFGGLIPANSNPSCTSSDWVRTTYDLPQTLPTQLTNWGYAQDFTFGAVTATENEQVKTWYSYDEWGRVTWMSQQFKAFGDKLFTLDYNYDFLGIVSEVIFQKNIPQEAFHHHYTYDGDQRLISVQTSLDGDPNGMYGYTHASYDYYLNGPLKRIVLADDLQGVDFTYTIQGWLKAINNPLGADPGDDGGLGVATPDVFSTAMEYFPGDYSSFDNPIGNSTIVNSGNAQYNGNITGMVWGRDNLAKPEPGPDEIILNSYQGPEAVARSLITLDDGFDSGGNPFSAVIDPDYSIIPGAENDKAYAYQYDDKYQLTDARFWEGPDFDTPTDQYRVTNLLYDENGNIQSIDRFWEDAANVRDDFDYTYIAGTNQLAAVSNYVNDYDYNEIGQMIAEKDKVNRPQDLYLEYDVTGKVKALWGSYDPATRSYSSKKFAYLYDDRGFRIGKIAYDDNDDTIIINQTWYARDASGNIMAIYAPNEGTGAVEQSEVPIYGNGRLGIAFRNPNRYKYNYQLTDHLGNVRAVISKLKFMETATMEPENLWLEQDAFANVEETAWGSEGPLDHTTPEPTGYVSYLNGAQGQLVGPVKSLRVTQGDRVEMEVFANYYEATSTGNLVGSMAGLLTGPLNLAPTGENTQILSTIDNALTGAALVPGNGDNTPKAYLQYLFVDDNFEYAQPAGVTPYVKMTNAAQVQFNPGVVAAHEKLSLAFDVPEDGYMYIYVATESAEDIDIFFDDFTVKHLGVDIIQRTDYYPFGSVLTHWDKELEDYRFGYQGEFSEEDKETGWNQFGARMWDSVIARWLSNDPARQYASGYLGMGNNPIGQSDEDGRYSRFGAWWRQKLHMPFADRYEVVPGEWALGWNEWTTGFDGQATLRHFSITQGGPGPGVGIDFYARFEGAARVGPLLYNDVGTNAFDFKYDVGSVDLRKYEFGYHPSRGLYYEPSSGSINFSSQLETALGEFDFEQNINPLTGETEGKAMIGLGFIRAGEMHHSVHGNIFAIGVAEDASRSFGSPMLGAGGEAEGFLGIAIYPIQTR